MIKRGIKINPTAVLTAAGVTYCFDSTCNLIETPAAAPGTYRGRWANYGLKGTIKVGDQDVTYALQGLTGVAGTSSDWEDEASGTGTFSANTTYPVRLKPQTPDWHFKITNGGTGPSALTFDLMLIPIEQTEG